MASTNDGGNVVDITLEPITIRVLDQIGEETYFKLNMDTKMQVVFDTYAQRKGTPSTSLDFFLDGENISPNQTPIELDLDHLDKILCVPKPFVEADSTPITIYIRDMKGEETYFKIKKSTLLHKVFVVYAERKGIKVSSLRFLYKGERVYRNGDTPQTFNMIDGDEIDCLLEQSGS